MSTPSTNSKKDNGKRSLSSELSRFRQKMLLGVSKFTRLASDMVALSSLRSARKQTLTRGLLADGSYIERGGKVYRVSMAMPFAADVCAAALSSVGIREDPPYRNDGAELRRLLERTKWKPGEAWCLFACQAFVLAGTRGRVAVPRWFLQDGYVPGLVQRAEEQGCIGDDVSTGSVFCVHNPSGHYYHAVLCLGEGDTPGTINVISPNSYDGSTGQDDSIREAVYSVDVGRFVYWADV